MMNVILAWEKLSFYYAADDLFRLFQSYMWGNSVDTFEGVECYAIMLLCVFAILRHLLHSKQHWVVLTQIWVKYGQTQMLG